MNIEKLIGFIKDHFYLCENETIINIEYYEVYNEKLFDVVTISRIETDKGVRHLYKNYSIMIDELNSILEQFRYSAKSYASCYCVISVFGVEPEIEKITFYR